MLLFCAELWAGAARADEIRLKDGKKLHGVIVGYEDNMFKVKTDFGFVLVEKDKIASIIPDSPGQPAPAKAEPKPTDPIESKMESTAEPSKKERAAAILTNANVRPELPAPNRAATDTKAPPLKTTVVVAPKATLVTATAPPPPPKEEPPANREEIQGNLYINHEFAFRMYKAPSWQIID